MDQGQTEPRWRNWLRFDDKKNRLITTFCTNLMSALGISTSCHGERLNIATSTSYLDHEYAARHVEAGGYVEIAISDIGLGMPPARARGA
jgi:hypothetical protein